MKKAQELAILYDIDIGRPVFSDASIFSGAGQPSNYYSPCTRYGRMYKIGQLERGYSRPQKDGAVSFEDVDWDNILDHR